jgi:hypothetical protein
VECDAVVTDPPYGLRFMGKHWDCEVPGVEIWRAVIASLKGSTKKSEETRERSPRFDRGSVNSRMNRPTILLMEKSLIEGRARRVSFCML